MRTRNVILACLAMLTMGSVQVQAQGLGGLLKKAKKVLDTVKEQTTMTSSDSKSQSSTASSTASGGTGWADDPSHTAPRRRHALQSL